MATRSVKSLEELVLQKVTVATIMRVLLFQPEKPEVGLATIDEVLSMYDISEVLREKIKRSILSLESMVSSPFHLTTEQFQKLKRSKGSVFES
ncbi:hypothetical protein TNIN_450711 [Trichonephila inaurata madagascariensis]|uniref:Uncharacterized protein n=1 Tax=Trichonephila inaurata madagascariensis TaxID=2747483 RepID=A0A8X6IBX4_9ARAC|nr:hypothetical protein TNIN_450711 [Trichonephila inaurata madagascariensis]